MDKYSKAPYTFVSLPEKSIVAYDDISQIPKHNIIDKNLLNGYIDFEIKNENPIIISDGESESSFKNSEGNFIIPGRTLRGVIRNNAAILSFSNLSDEIQDTKFSFRSFDKSILSKIYKKKLGINVTGNKDKRKVTVSNIKAGYIYKKSKYEYRIKPAKTIDEKQFFSISEEYLQEYLNKKTNKIKFMYTTEVKKLITNKTLNQQGKKEKFLRECKNKQPINNGGYQPYLCKNISFDISNKKIVNISLNNEFKNKGYILNSGFIEKKRSHYIINEYDDNIKEIVLSGEKYKFIDYYNDDYKRTKKDKSRDSEFYKLPEKMELKEGKPIFYGEFEGQLFLGFTPYLRIPYKYSIKDGISENYKNTKGISYIDGIFGFSNNKNNFKSRVSFEDCVCDKNAKETKTYKYILGEPRASCYKNYIVQNDESDLGRLKTYDDKNFKIRGIKKYWLKNYIDRETNANGKFVKSFKAIDKGNIFKGRINFKNLREDELGLILWAIKYNKNSWENIGLAKPYGFGVCEINNIELKIEDSDKAYNKMCFDFYCDETEKINDYKKAFKVKASQTLGKNKKIENEKSIKEFMQVKTKFVSENKKSDFEYTNLNDFSKVAALEELETIARNLKIKRADEQQLEEVAVTKNKNKNKNNKNRKKEKLQDNQEDDSPWAILRNYKR